MSDDDIDVFEREYDHNLVTLLETLRRIDLQQFVQDLKFNDPSLAEKMKYLLNTENTYARRK